MSTVTHLPEEDRRELVWSRAPITLDGEPALITGWRNEFATVSRRDGKGGRVEFAWSTVKRIVDAGGKFES